MITEAIILAGGLGTRLRSVTGDIPKPMALVHGKPFLTYQLDYLTHFGIVRTILAVGYKHEAIRSYLADEYQSINLIYSIEDEPCGTGGGILKALDHVTGNEVLVLNGDSFNEINLMDFYTFHHSRQSLLTMALGYQENTSRFGRVIFNDYYQITGFMEKGQDSEEGWINRGLYLIETGFYRDHSHMQRFSLESDFLPGCLASRMLYGFPTEGYFIDIGTPESYRRAEDEFARFEDQ